MFLVFLSLSSLSQTTRKLCDRSNRKVSLHPFQVLERAFSSGNIPQMGLSIGPNKRCHIFCPLPGFLRANMALNIACCHVTSNCHPAQLRNANHCKPKCWPVIPLIYWGAMTRTSAFLSAAVSATVCCGGEKIDIYLVYSPPSNPPFILQLGWIWSLSEALWLLTELSKLQRE